MESNDQEEEPIYETAILLHVFFKFYVVQLINEANAAKDATMKVEKLTAVKDLIIHRDPALLDNFLDEVIGFQSDTSVDVRRTVLMFIEEACKKDNELLSKLIINISLMLNDANINVQKKAISVMAQLYPVALKWIAKTRTASSVLEQTWDYILQLKSKIIPSIDAENDGIRTYAIKFVEQVIVAQSSKSAQSESVPSAPMSLDQIPRDHRLISYRRLEADGKALFQKLLDLLGSQHISVVNLMICMGSLTLVACQRPEFMERVVLAFDSLHVNLPPTLAKSQVASVRKSLKTHFLSLLKHPSSVDYQPQMIMLLTDLGAKPVELTKSLPPGSEFRQQQLRAGGTKRGASGIGFDENSNDSMGGSSSVVPKKARFDEDDEDEDEDTGTDRTALAVQIETESAEKQRQNAIETTANFLYSKLVNPASVTDLVLISLVVLPETMPAHFQASYTPIAAAGTEAQIRHLSRLMAAQLTAKGFGPGAEQLKALEAKKQQMRFEESGMTPSITLTTSAGHSKTEKTVAVPIISVGAQPASQTTRQKLHKFGLAHITKPFDRSSLIRMMSQGCERIMAAEKRVVNGGATMAHGKILVHMASTFNRPELHDALEAFILADAKNRADIAVLWVYQEYCTIHEFNRTLIEDSEERVEKYDQCLVRLLSKLFERGEHKESLFHKLLLEAPIITINALRILMRACMDTVHGSFGLTTLKEMILTRPKQRNELLRALLDFTCYERPELRHHSLEIAKELYTIPTMRENVKEYVKRFFLNNLRQEIPPGSLFGEAYGRTVNPGKWEEDSIRASLYLYLYLLPVDHSLIHDLADVYVAAIPDVKRVILKLLEGPIKAVGIHSPELLLLVERCPPGSETLITLIVRLLTERNPPTPELVRRVQELYPKRVSDVRFLIPVLTGLSKKEILSVMPELIRLKPEVVKQVFNRLLHGKSPETGQQPLSPAELMVALHQMESSNDEMMKHVIAAVDTLLSDRKVYTKEVMAGVIQHLVEQQPLPVLLMRTILKALNTYPQALIGFVMNMMQRLILKQVWKYPQIWVGFIRCCHRTRPQSYQILFQLPAPKLQHAFEIMPDLKESFVAHVSSLPMHQKAHVPQAVWRALEEKLEQVPGEQGASGSRTVSESTTDGTETEAAASELQAQQQEAVSQQQSEAAGAETTEGIPEVSPPVE